MTGQVNMTITAGGLTIAGSTARTGDGTVTKELSLSAADSGTCTRSDANTAVVTRTSGTAVTTGKVMVFWTESGVSKWRYDVDAVVDGSSITVDLGSGDDYCAVASTAVTICNETNVADCGFDADNCSLLVINSTKKSGIVFEDSGNAVLLAALLQADEPVVWAEEGTHAKLITGNAVAEIKVANGGTAAATLKVVALLDTV